MTPEHYLGLATVLFGMGIIGIVGRRNLFVVYMSVELMLSSVNLALATFSRTQNDMGGGIMALLMIALIAAEAAVFLAMIITLFRARRSIDSNDYTELTQEHA